jgi:putative pyruvate formate lyase activating enzyme
VGFDDLSHWREPDLAGRLEWYRAVSANRLPAKYLIAARVPAPCAPGAPEPELWRAFDAASAQFLELREAIRAGEALPRDRAAPSLLDLAAELARRMLAHCNFCRWECGVDRSAGTKLGACKLAAETRVSSWFHHRGEELVYRGREGSGTIFFTSCNMRCAFCQNGDISTDRLNGEEVDARALATMAWVLRMEGCHNVNWVGGDPAIHLHTIVAAIASLETLRPDERSLAAAYPTKADAFMRFRTERSGAQHRGLFNVPMLWNSNFYLSDEAMRLLRVLMDVWLPDHKFGPGRCAIELARTPHYWETVNAHLASLRDWGEDFTIRHLIMPGHVECCTRPVLEWIAANLPGAPVNLMDQYHPDNYCEPGNPNYRSRYAPLARRPSPAEIRAALGHARRLGIAFETITFERTKTGIRA